MFVAVVVGLMLAAAPDEGSRKTAAAELIDEGNVLFEKGELKAALARFEAAYATYPSPKIFLNLANTHVALGENVDGAENYQKFLDQSGLEATSPLMEQARQALEEISPKLGWLRFSGEAFGAEVYVDSKLAGKTPLPPVRVAIGEHEVATAIIGRAPLIQKVVVGSGQEVEVAIAFAADVPGVEAITEWPAVRPDPKIEAPAASSDDGVPWLWIGIGAVLAVIGVSAGVVAASGGGEPLPPDEFGVSKFSEWKRP